MKKTIVYVDAFNLYYGAVRGTPYKWLDLSKMCDCLLPHNDIIQIKYFTALIKGRESDPQQPQRQKIFLRALQTIPNLEIIYGHFLSHSVRLPLVKPSGKSQYAYVIKTEEKGSDVNLATHLLNDAYQDQYEVAVVVSNDSDLLAPIKIVKADLGKTVGILNPHRYPSKVLLQVVDFYKPIRSGVLSNCQFPDILHDEKGSFHKPDVW